MQTTVRISFEQPLGYSGSFGYIVERDEKSRRKKGTRREQIVMSESNAVANGLAGAGGGIIAQIITYPLQTVPNYPFFSPLSSLSFS